MDVWNSAASTPDDAEAQGAGVRELNQHVKQDTTFETYQHIYHQALHRRQGPELSAPLDTAYHTIADLAQRQGDHNQHNHGSTKPPDQTRHLLIGQGRNANQMRHHRVGRVDPESQGPHAPGR